MEENQPSIPKLPLVLAGPILRKTSIGQVTLWFTTSRPCEPTVLLQPKGASETSYAAKDSDNYHCLKAGERLYVHLLTIEPIQTLPLETWIDYKLDFDQPDDEPIGTEHLHYENRETHGFAIQSRINRLLHGSCRKPHLLASETVDKKDSGEGLQRADALIDSLVDNLTDWPAVLLMSGDQIYADDVGGPMLRGIHQLIQILGIPDEKLEGTKVSNSNQLHASEAHFYEREKLLPDNKVSGALRDQFFGGAKKPVFTSSNAQNHLMSLGEMLAMYLLVWSPNCWKFLDLSCPDCITNDAHRQRYADELVAIEAFRHSLPQAARVMAHLPTAMIFDDHDVTDDWNLTIAWEQAAYEHPLSNRVIGNALLAYFVCQGWGNAPEKFDDGLIQRVNESLQSPGSKQHKALIDELFHFNQWHYHWDTQPCLIVLDTRTQRWRSERSIHAPSGLMDWESITDLQHELLDHKAVIMVSPAPVFGVKLIEIIQAIFTFFGKPLIVDAENWMAHRGAAYALLNLFRHKRTPRNFVILSGDVHYSFAYNIKLRGHHHSPDIWQITSSGIRNEFPPRLLDIFDRLNRWLYAPWSPLNWFTKRRNMRVSPRKPEPSSKGERLLNGSGIGLVDLDDEGAPVRITQLCSNGREVVFMEDEANGVWE